MMQRNEPWQGAYGPNLANTSYTGNGISTTAQSPSMPLAPNYANQMRLFRPTGPVGQMGPQAHGHVDHPQVQERAPGIKYNIDTTPQLAYTYEKQPIFGNMGLTIDRRGIDLNTLKQIADIPKFGIGSKAQPLPSQIYDPGGSIQAFQQQQQPQGPDPFAMQRYKQYQDMLLRSDLNNAGNQASQLQQKPGA